MSYKDWLSKRLEETFKENFQSLVVNKMSSAAS